MTSRIRVLQVIPDGSGGAHDHAAVLAREWTQLGLDSATLAGKDFHTTAPSQHGDVDVIFLHMSAYGYARWGLCFWIPRLLSRLKRNAPALRIVTLFHEVATSGPIPTTAFWSSFAQKAISAQIAGLSDAVVTNSSDHGRSLREIGVVLDIRVWPVFSNVGELREPPAFARRADRVILFGSESVRRWATQPLSAQAWRSIRVLGPIVEVGTGRPVLDAQPGVEWRGELASEAVSDLLSQAKFGLVCHPGWSLSKSGTFAAYAAHGCIPLVSWPAGSEPDGLTVGAEFLATENANSVDPALLPRVSENIWTWYQGHTAGVQAGLFSELIRSILTQDRR
jgi:hypothetical protein